MLVTLKEILDGAEQRGCAIGAFNAPNLTSARAVIAAAEALSQPVILMHAQVHEDMGICRLEEMEPILLGFADRACVPVCVHLDHGSSFEYLRRAIDMGFSSVMYDGSALPFEENVRNTKRVIEWAHAAGCSVEAEIGSMSVSENGESAAEDVYTVPADAERFVNLTSVDALACAFGTVHGFYRTAPQLDFDRLSEIHTRIGIPVVMHGGSGVNHDDYRKVIRCGVRKVNYYTYLSKAGAAAVSGKTYSQFHDLLQDAETAMTEDVKTAITVFSGL